MVRFVSYPPVSKVGVIAVFNLDWSCSIDPFETFKDQGPTSYAASNLFGDKEVEYYGLPNH